MDDAGFNLDLLIEGGTLAAVRAYNQQLRSLGYLTRNIELAFLNLSGLPYDLERVAQGAPWAGCQNESCAWLIRCAAHAALGIRGKEGHVLPRSAGGLPPCQPEHAHGLEQPPLPPKSCDLARSASDACEQWDLLLALPVPRDNKRYFMILVWTGWGLLAFKV